MDTDTLVEDLIDDGGKLVKELLRQGFEVTAAFWLKASEDDQWYFYVVSPVVDTEGLAQAYRRLHAVARAMPRPFGIDPLGIKLIAPANPMAQDILAIHQRAPGPRAYPIRWSGKRLGNVSIDGAYLYPPPAPAAA
jgi:hypothetical protein